MRKTVLVRIAPDRTTMYRLGSDGTVYHRFRLTVANRGHEQAIAPFSIEGLPGTRFVNRENAIVVNGGQTVEREVEIAASLAASRQPGVNHFRLVSHVGKESNAMEETFITPYEDSR